MVGEILELDHHARKHFRCSGNEFVQQLVIGHAGEPALAQPDIERVFEHRRIVAADVEGDRQAQLRMHACTRGIQRQLAHRNSHAVGAQVAQAENALAVGDDDDAGLVGPVAQQLRDASAVVGADEQAARPLKDVAEFLTSQSNRRRVDQRLHFVDVVAQHAKEQRFVAVVQGIERDEFFQRIGQQAQARQHAHRLLILVVHVRRQKAAQVVLFSLRFGKAGASVQCRVAQQRKTGGHRLVAVGIGFFIHYWHLLFSFVAIVPSVAPRGSVRLLIDDAPCNRDLTMHAVRSFSPAFDLDQQSKGSRALV